MKRSIFIFIILLTILFSPCISLCQSQVIKRVVIDAGHGGKDPGACYKKTYEKDIVLSIALKLGKYIQDNYKDVEVIYTRKTDEFIELHKRAAIANDSKADLFISLHCNSNPSPDPYGFETFVMGPNKTKGNIEIAKKENAAILLEDNYSKQYDGFDPNSPEADVVFTLFRNAYSEQSLALAYLTQKQFKDKLKRFDRGVKQAGFLVLYKTIMPSVLVECGFVSNPDEEKFINNENGQTYIASAIYRAFKEYKANSEGTAIKTDEVDKLEIKEIPQPIDTNKIVKPIVLPKEQIKTTEITDKKPEKTIEKIEKKDSVKHIPVKCIDKSSSKPSFKVQVMNSNKKLPLNSTEFKGVSGIEEYKDGVLFKYTVGNFATIEEASQMSKKMKEKGFTGAFIVAFVDGKKITLDEARNLLK